MIVVMVDVGSVRMLVLRRIVLVRMVVPPPRGEAFVGVRMMPIVVTMPMGMVDGRMPVAMPVGFLPHEQDGRPHQRRRDQLRRQHRLAQEEPGEREPEQR